jgi:hypothetical protein
MTLGLLRGPGTKGIVSCSDISRSCATGQSALTRHGREPHWCSCTPGAQRQTRTARYKTVTTYSTEHRGRGDTQEKVSPGRRSIPLASAAALGCDSHSVFLPVLHDLSVLYSPSHYLTPVYSTYSHSLTLSLSLSLSLSISLYLSL